MLKRLFDIFFSLLGITILFIPLFIVSVLVMVTSKGGIFYKQIRVGKDGVDFSLLKFRTMKPGSDKTSLLTVGEKDNRVTKIGFPLRKYKIDEFPQLLNVFLGDMSLVGPRPEVRKYVDLYNSEQKHVLSVKPGMTDYASIEYSKENELLGKAENPERAYVNEIMPAKLKLNLQYIKEQTLFTDLKIIFRTIGKILR